MKNTIFQLHDTDSVLAEDPHKIEFYCCQTNELDPHRDILELGISITGKDGLQIDFETDEEGLNELIDYLENLKTYIYKFNKTSKHTPL